MHVRVRPALILPLLFLLSLIVGVIGIAPSAQASPTVRMTAASPAVFGPKSDLISGYGPGKEGSVWPRNTLEPSNAAHLFDHNHGDGYDLVKWTWSSSKVWNNTHDHGTANTGAFDGTLWVDVYGHCTNQSGSNKVKVIFHGGGVNSKYPPAKKSFMETCNGKDWKIGAGNWKGVADDCHFSILGGDICYDHHPWVQIIYYGVEINNSMSWEIHNSGNDAVAKTETHKAASQRSNYARAA